MDPSRFRQQSIEGFVSSPGCLGSVRLYQFSLKDDKKKEIYSFCFRYSILLKKHLRMIAPDYHLAFFPAKSCCFFKTSDKSRCFQNYFGALLKEDDEQKAIRSLSKFTQIFSLNSPDVIECFLNFDDVKDRVERLQGSFFNSDETNMNPHLLNKEYPSFLLMTENPSEVQPSDLSHHTVQNIDLLIKREENKVTFLNFLEERLNRFSNKYQKLIPFQNLTAFRLLIMKIKLKLIHKILWDLELMPNEGSLLGNMDEFKKFLKIPQGLGLHEKFMNLNKEAIPIFKELQKELIIESAKSSNFLYKKAANRIIKFLNPKINKWKTFCDDFKKIVEPFLKSLKIYIQVNVIRESSKIQRVEEKHREIIMLFKNLQILLNMKEIFNKMQMKTVKILNFETFVKADAEDCRNALDYLGF